MTKRVSRVDADRRALLKALGLGAGGAALLSACGDTDIVNEVSIEVNRELIEPQVEPQDYAQPGNPIYYASTCRMCPAGCGVHARVRQGRVVKLEGSPTSPVNEGRLCPMGQAGLHAHYNPDRITTPMMRKGGKLAPVSWDEAMDRLRLWLGKEGGRIAWLTGVVSGHRRALIEAHREATNASHHVFDPMAPEVAREAAKAVFGDADPVYALEKAELVVSFGADFLGPWQAPVPYARRYTRMRTPPRGTLVVVEPKMTLAGANADRWIAVRPGGEGALALALAALLVRNHGAGKEAPEAVRRKLAALDVDALVKQAGARREAVDRVAKALAARRPSLVLAGGSLEREEGGLAAAKAALMLNLLLGNVGKTVLPRPEQPFADLAPKLGGWSELVALAKDLAAGRVDTLVVLDSNPLFHAPKAMGLEKAWARAKRRIAFSMFMDETTAKADLVLPLHSYLEEWDTSMPWQAESVAVLNVQQPVMYPVFPKATGKGETRAFGDLMLAVLAGLDGRFKRWPNMQAYVMDALWTMRDALDEKVKVGTGQTPEEAFRYHVLGQGFVRLKTKPGRLAPRWELPEVAAPAAGLALVAPPRLGLYDGRHANLPWLQELPDQLAGVVWDSWVEMHPKLAEKLDVQTGDIVRIELDGGAIELGAVVTPAIHPEVVAVPLGQGHEEYGRYAKGRGVHPWRFVKARWNDAGALVADGKPVKLRKVRDNHGVDTLKRGDLVVESLVSTQAGRRIVKTVSTKDLHRFELRKRKEV